MSLRRAWPCFGPAGETHEDQESVGRWIDVGSPCGSRLLRTTYYANVQHQCRWTDYPRLPLRDPVPAECQFVGRHGLTHPSAGHPSAAAISGPLNAPSRASRMMSACPACRAVSSMRCRRTHRTVQSSGSGNQGASGSGTRRPKSSISLSTASVRAHVSPYCRKVAANVSSSRGQNLPCSHQKPCH